MSLYSGHTLSLTFPIGKTVVAAILWIFLVELVVRQQAVQALLLPPSVIKDQIFIGVRLWQLERYVTESGKVDCLILGTSSAARGIDPQVFQATFYEQTRQEITCFNFGTPGMFATASPDVAFILVREYHPRVIIYATNEVDFYPYTSDNLSNSPWLRQNLKDANLEGWLADHSYLYNYSTTYRNVTEAAYQNAFYWWMPQLRADGFWVTLSAHQRALSSLESVPNKKAEKLWADTFADSSKVSQGLDHLAAWSQLSQTGTTVVVVEIPLHSSVTYFFQKDERETLRSQISARLDKIDLPYWSEDSQPALPNTAWADRVHLNHNGTAIFSRWLGEKVGQHLTDENGQTAPMAYP